MSDYLIEIYSILGNDTPGGVCMENIDKINIDIYSDR